MLKHQTSTSIQQVPFNPPAGQTLDVEVLDADQWRRRLRLLPEHFNAPSRIAFYQFVLVTRGSFIHSVDFISSRTPAHSLLLMHPGQVQRFETNRAWEGWVMIFRPEAYQLSAHLREQFPMLASLDELPLTWPLAATERAAFTEALSRAAMDTIASDGSALALALLRTQLQVLLLRVMRTVALPAAQTASGTASLQRHFTSFRRAIEQHFREWHQVAQYAQLLGMTEKTLGRATLAIAGISAKAFLSQRIALEAKRLLAYADWPVAHVAEQLGFDEPTNFVKFFRREAGASPREFRQKHRG